MGGAGAIFTSLAGAVVLSDIYRVVTDVPSF
jgi:hypothetical protein